MQTLVWRSRADREGSGSTHSEPIPPPQTLPSNFQCPLFPQGLFIRTQNVLVCLVPRCNSVRSWHWLTDIEQETKTFAERKISSIVNGFRSTFSFSHVMNTTQDRSEPNLNVSSPSPKPGIISLGRTDSQTRVGSLHSAVPLIQ